MDTTKAILPIVTSALLGVLDDFETLEFLNAFEDKVVLVPFIVTGAFLEIETLSSVERPL